MKYLLKLMMDLIYRAPSQLRNYKNEHEDEQVLAYSACKAIQLESEQHIERGKHWMSAKRGFLILTDAFLSCDDWRIDLKDIEKSQVVKYRSGMVLKVTLKTGVHYQFGIQHEPKLLKQTALKMEVIAEKMKYSLLSVLIRVVLVVNTIIILGLILMK